ETKTGAHPSFRDEAAAPRVPLEGARMRLPPLVGDADGFLVGRPGQVAKGQAETLDERHPVDRLREIQVQNARPELELMTNDSIERGAAAGAQQAPRDIVEPRAERLYQPLAPSVPSFSFRD